MADRVGGEERKARCFAAHITHDPWPRAHALRRTLRTACFFPGVLGARFFCAALDLGGIVGAKRRALTRRDRRASRLIGETGKGGIFATPAFLGLGPKPLGASPSARRPFRGFIKETVGGSWQLLAGS